MKLFEMKQQRKAALDAAEKIVLRAEQTKRPLSESEQNEYEAIMAGVSALADKIDASERTSSLRTVFPGSSILTGVPGGRSFSEATARPVRFSAAYADDFHSYLASGGQNISAALYEGSSPAGGYAVPVTVAGEIVPLAPTDMGVRKIATVVPTTMDIKIPRATTISTAAQKAESGASTNVFQESDPTLDQFTLSAFLAGLTHTISWELAQDVPSFQQFCISDALLGQSIFEENWYVNGSGTSQPQGLVGNTGSGITGVQPDTNGNLVPISSTFDVLGTLKGAYHNGASWLMQRATAISIRLAQTQANLFQPVFTRVGDQDFLHGYPVEYSTAMPAAAAGATPVLFGNFKIGYTIGDRGGSGINIKILDQPLATQGQIILLAYRRTDGRVRRAEAIQAITLHS